MMKTLKQLANTLVVALFLAVAVTAATETPKCVYAGCGSGTIWNISAEFNDSQSSSTKGGQTTSTQDISSRSVQHSDDGQTFDDTQTHHKNVDGSSTDHEETHYEDKFGNGCSSDGEPVTEDRTVDDETDKDGNRKQHVEIITQKNGKCMKRVRDREWDRKGKLIKDTGWITTEVPCTKYILEVTKQGNWSVDASAGYTETYQADPETVTIPLSLKNGNYTGNYKGDFHVTMQGLCTGGWTIPMTINVTAQKDELGDLEFNMQVTRTVSEAIACPWDSRKQVLPTIVDKYTFTLPDEDGASRKFDDDPAYPQINWPWTVTLKEP